MSSDFKPPIFGVLAEYYELSKLSFDACVVAELTVVD
jgi:hypothetical protein